MEPDLVNEFIPGDQNMQPIGIEPLLPRQDTGGGMELPNIKQIAGNVIKNKAIDYAAGKLGLNAAQATGLMSILGIGSNVFAPLAAVSALSGRSLGISDYLANKRAQKEMQKQQTMSEAASITNRIQGQITPQDIIDDRGRGQIPSRTTSAPAPTRQARQTSGLGGLHSGY